MTRAQLVHFTGATGGFLSVFGAPGRAVYGLTALTMALVKLLPRISLLKSVPASLGAVTGDSFRTPLWLADR